MAKPSRPFRDLNAPKASAWPRVLFLFSGLMLAGVVGWTNYTHRDIGQYHGQEREVAEFRFGVSLKKMINLPVLEQDRERFGDLCRMFQANCHRLIDPEMRALCRPI